ncbi:MAG: hypothetical protein PT958_03030 [Firmicutes bacterium]|nr:hypothetical protein [Bacillota bacterium]
MISLTKSYLKKIVTSPLFCICLIAFIFFSSLYNTQCLKLALTNRQETVQETESTEQDQQVVFSVVVEAVPNTPMPVPAQMTAEYLFADVAASAYPALCAALFAAQFLFDERKYRFLQNFPGIGRYPWKLVGAHSAVLVLESAGITLAYLVCGLFSGLVVFGGRIAAGSWLGILKIFAMTFVLLLGVSGIMMFVSQIVKKQIVIIAAALLLLNYGLILELSPLEQMYEKVEEFAVTYLPILNSAVIASDVSAPEFLRSVGQSLLYFAVPVLAHYGLLRKKGIT